MLTQLAQTDTAGTPGLGSVAAIILLTWVLVGLAKKFFSIHGRATLAVSLGVSVGLTIIALATGQLAVDWFTAIIAVIVLVAGAAGVDASSKTIFSGAPKVLALLAATLLITGCSTMTPSQRYAVTSNAFSATVDTVADLIDAGLIEDDKLDDIQLVATEIDTELDALDEALRNDTPFDFAFVLARVESKLGRLAQYQLDAEGIAHAHAYPDPMDRACFGGRPALLGDQSHRSESTRGGTRSDAGRARPGQARSQGSDVWPGRRDRLASQLRYLSWRYDRLTSRIAA
ncbi:MAG: hypothetical protein AAF085_14735 [Planctomycetota bacterium]